MAKEKQSVKRRIFISNTFMVLLTLSIFLFVNLLIVKLYENPYKDNLIFSSELAENTEQIKNILMNWDPSTEEGSIQTLSEKLEGYGFYLCVESEEQVLFSNTDFPVSDLLNGMGRFFQLDDQVHVYVQNYMTILTQYSESENLKVYAMKGDYQEFGSQNNSFTVLLILLFIDGILCIGALLLISRFFTKRLINHITIPLDALSEATQRMKEGDFSQPVVYAGDIEFENVCDGFNQMQMQVNIANGEKEAYEKARIEMIAGISHDLKTPLTAIRGTIKGFLDGVVTTPEMRNKFLEAAYRRTIDMDRLLERLFYFSKLETGNMPLYLEETQWKEFLQTYVNRYKMLEENHSVKLVLEEVQENIFSNIDREHMKRILDNLLENSKKYGNTEDLEITIGTFEQNSYFVIEVSDNGSGVSTEKISHIFEQFYRGDESRNKKDGNGLGLYIVKYLVETMGGVVYAENRDGLTVGLRVPISKKGA